MIDVTSPEDPADGLAAVVALRRLAERMEAAEVERAMRDGWSWPEVAEALGEARELGSPTVEAEHLLLALTRSDNAAAAALRAKGLDHDAVAEALAAETERSLAAV